MVLRAAWGLGVGGHPIGDGLRQRVLEGLRRELYMHLRDAGRLRRFLGACFAVLRRNCTWAELGCLVPSAEAAKRRFRRWSKRGMWERLMQHGQPSAGPDALHVERTGPGRNGAVHPMTPGCRPA